MRLGSITCLTFCNISPDPLASRYPQYFESYQREKAQMGAL